MIEELHIENLGVIESAHVEFEPGLTVLTGETGAGKTMVLTSLQLLLGQRADSSKVRAGEKEAVVDGVFSVDPNVELSYDLENENVIVTRKVGTSRSRAYLDRRPAPVSALTELAPHLAVVHGQADQIELRSTTRQRELLDRFGGQEHRKLYDDYREAWHSAVEAKRELDEFAESLAEAETEIAQLRPAVDKIRALDPQDGEEEELRLEAERIAAEEVAKMDAVLIGSYPTETDLQRAYNERFDLLEQSLESARVGIRSQEKSLAELLAHAADLERDGQKVPPAITDSIARTRDQVNDQRAYLERRETERAALQTEYDQLLARYRELKSGADDSATP